MSSYPLLDRPLARWLLAALATISAVLAPTPAGAGAYGGSSDVADVLRLDDVLLFKADNPLGRPEIWRTDGTADGTWPTGVAPADCPVAGIQPGAVTDTRAFYVVQCDTDYQLWVTDGTSAGTRRFTFVDPPRRVSSHQVWVPNVGKLFFAVSRLGDGADELWVSDGTPDGTGAVASLPVAGQGELLDMVALPNKLVYRVTNNTQPQGDVDLRVSDGTPAGTRSLGSIGDFTRSPGPMAAVGDRVVWSVYQQGSLELYSTHGFDAPAAPFATIEDAARRGASAKLELHRGLLYFTAFDSGHDLELWRTDGTAAGTLRLTDVATALPFSTFEQGSPPRFSDPGDGNLWFSLFDEGIGGEPWRTDGTPAGTEAFADLCPGACSSNPGEVIEHGGSLYLWAHQGVPQEATLWRSDGTAVGTEVLRTFSRDLGDFTALELRSVGSRLLLLGTLEGPGHDQEVWRLGADGSTTPLTEFLLDQALGSFFGFFAHEIGGRLFFVADDGLHGNEPWVSDGTVPGTHLLVDLSPQGTASHPPGTPRLQVEPGQDGSLNIRWEVLDDHPFLTHALIEIEVRSVDHEWQPYEVYDALAFGSTQGQFTPGQPYTFRARLINAAGVGPWTAEVNVTALSTEQLDGPCTPGPETLCFGGGQFSVSAAWRNQHGDGESGQGQAIAGDAGGRSGYFWFFRPDNVELIVKILDGEAINGNHWVFYGALSDVEYWVTVIDHLNRRTRTYRNVPGAICGRGDTKPFESQSLAAASATGEAASARLATRPPLSAFSFDGGTATLDGVSAAAGTACVEDASTLCLLDGRFRVRVDWQDQHNGGSGVGGALPFADRSGFFWFFRPDNVELVVKVLDGTPVNGKIWVFYGALSDVGYEIEVTDMNDGTSTRRYVNEPGNLCGSADNSAF